MRDLFPGYYNLSETELSKMFLECIFTFDANVLLNIYRYTQETRDIFIKILEQLKDRLWLPYQAAFEYHKNRLSVISSQMTAYAGIVDKLVTIENTLTSLESSYSMHPLVNIKEITFAIKQAVDDSKPKLHKAKLSHPDLVRTDELREQLVEIFRNKIGSPSTGLEKLYQDAEKRYQQFIPPGYEDAKEKKGNNKYGDYILWSQIKDYAKNQQSEKRPIILVTDDKKEDWWLRHSGKTIGPRPELIQELTLDTGVQFYMYQSDQFMAHARNFLKLDKAQEAIEEVSQVLKQSESKFQGFSSSQQHSLLELRPNEIAALVCTMQHQFEPQETVSPHIIKGEMNNFGFTDIAISLALRALLAKGIISTVEKVSYNESYLEYQVTAKGFEWLSQNQDKLSLQMSYDTTSTLMDDTVTEDDIPF